MPKHDLEEDLQSQPNKRVRFDKSERGHTHNGSEQVEEMIDVCRIAEREAKDPASQTVAWSRHNLLAKIVSTSPARIAFSLVPLKKRKPQKAEQKSTFSIPLILAPEEDPHHISFSPAGSHLLLAVGAPHRLRLVLYHITTSGCINDWQVAQEWHLRFHQEYPVKVSSFQWLSEPRQASFQDGAFVRGKQAGCSVLQAGGQAFAAVLNSNEFLVGRFPAMETEFTAPCLLKMPLPGGRIGSLSPKECSTSTSNIPVASDPSPVASTALGLSMGLPASQDASSSTERVTHSAMTCLANESALLIATSTYPLPWTPDAPPKNEGSDPNNSNNNGAPEMSLDDELMLAFGGSVGANNASSPPKSQSIEASQRSLDPLSQINGLVEKKISLSKVALRWQPRTMHFEMSLQPLDPIYHANAHQPSYDNLLSMTWLHSVSMPPQLVVATTNQECRTTLLQSFTMTGEPFVLSEAFATMDCKKADVRQGPPAWTSFIDSILVQEGLVTQLQAALPSDPTSFLALLHQEQASFIGVFRWKPKLSMSTLDPLDKAFGPVVAFRISPNNTILSVTRSSEESDVSTCCDVPGLPRHVDFFAQRLAIAISQQNDLSDVVRCIPKDWAASVFTTLRAALQKVLPKDVSLDRSAILLELLRAQHSLRADRSTHASFSGVLVQLVACVNVFQTSSIKTRATEGGPTLFHKDSIWPLMGYTSFYCSCVRRIVAALARHDPHSNKQWPPEMIFLLYSPAIAVLRQLCQLAIKFHSFIFAFDAPPGTVAVEIARSVIDEMTNTNRSGFNLTQWAQFLDELPKKIDGTIDENMRNQLLAEAAPPDDPKEPLLTVMHDVLDAVKPLADPSLFKHSEDDEDVAWDIITRAKLPKDKFAYRHCTRCGSRTWKAQCICGAKWWMSKAS